LVCAMPSLKNISLLKRKKSWPRSGQFFFAEVLFQCLMSIVNIVFNKLVYYVFC